MASSLRPAKANCAVKKDCPINLDMLYWVWRKIMQQTEIKKDILKPLLDSDGIVVRWPKKKEEKSAVLEYLVTKFEQGKKYSELEINSVLKKWNAFGDHSLLRRELFDHFLLDRTPDCKFYWVHRDDGDFSIDEYLQKLISGCKSAFGTRLVYVGLQGSYLREEANKDSDIDIMLVIENLSVADMDSYREILKGIGDYEKSCGFIAGKNEMEKWNPLEICQLLHTTKDVYGSLSSLLPPATREDEINYVKISLGNLYHEICHRYIHADREKNVQKFRSSCKSFFFLIQNLHYLESGNFVLKKSDLKKCVSPKDKMILDFADLPDTFDYDESMKNLFAWCQNAFERIEAISKN